MSRVLPILFNTEMVRAILDERKTATRRAVKGWIPDDALWGYTAFTPRRSISCRGTYEEGYGEKFFKMPYEKGDILYVRETWQHLYELDGNEQIIEGTGKYYYAATDTIPFDTYVDSEGTKHEKTPWRPSIHMPKAAARIWLKVTDVGVEKLQDITGEGVLEEGVSNQSSNLSMGRRWENQQRMEFERVWNSTIKKKDLDCYGWQANPWVWVIEFERCKKPESEELK